MVRAIEQVGREMGKKTIAEFVENAAICERLREIGVRYGQGYGILAPRPIDEVLEIGRPIAAPVEPVEDVLHPLSSATG